MAETDYPQPFKHEDFGLVKSMLKPAPAPSATQKQNASGGVSGGSTTTVVRPPEVALPGAAGLAFVIGAKTSPSYTNGLSSPKDLYPAPVMNQQLNFAPVLDKPVVAWKLTVPEKITKVTFELICKGRSKPATIATTTLDVNALKEALKLAPSKDWTGGIELEKLFDLKKNKVKIDDEADAFPNGCLTATHSPYQLRMTITPDASASTSSFPLVAWTYIQVLVHSIEIKVGKPEMLAQERPDVEGDTNKTKVLAAERGIIGRLPTTNLAQNPQATYEVELESNLFRCENNNREVENDTDFQEYRKLWGNGPRVPLIATVLLKKADGTPTNQIPQALGNTKLLWDWEDSGPDRWKQAVSDATTKETKQFLEKLYKPGKLPTLPESSSNCPVPLGGKYGQNAAPVYPPQTPTVTFPYRVEAVPNRNWAAFSFFGAGDTAATSGVIFQPSRIAGDSYTVRVYLDLNREHNLNTATKIAAHPSLQASAGSFLILRKIKLRYLVRGGANQLGADPTQLTNYIKALYRRELFISLDVNQTAVNNTIYRQATVNAIDLYCRDANAHTNFKYLGLISRYMIVPNPEDNSPGVSLFDKGDFLNRVEAVFRAGVIRRMSLTQTNPEVTRLAPNEELVGNTSGARGILLTDKRTAPEWVLFYDPAALFTDTEQLTGYASGKIYDKHLETSRSCWGHEISRSYATGAKYNDSIEVVFRGGGTVKITYPFSGIGRNLATELTNIAKRTLREALGGFGQTIKETGSVDITLKGNNNLPNSFTRFNILENYLEQLFTEGVIVDRKAFWENTASYGHSFKVVNKTVQDENGLYREAVVVALPNGTTSILTYDKTSTKTLMTELSESVFQDLRKAVIKALTNVPLGEHKNFVVEIRTRTNSANSRNRLANLKIYLNQIFNEYATSDTRPVWQQSRTLRTAPDWADLNPSHYQRLCRKALPVEGILPLLIKEYIRLEQNTDEGIALLHIPGRTNLASLPIAGQGHTELKITGASYPYASGVRQVGIVYISSVNPNNVATYPGPTKSVPSIFAHEVAHALYLPHAYPHSSGEVASPEPSQIAHLAQDNCLMNYDVDSEHFCAICMLRMRGWNWRQLSNVVPGLEYRVTLEIDDPATLFSFSANHREGLKARLQTMGLFNRPLDHADSEDCLDFSFRHFLELFPSAEGANGLELENFLNQEIKKFLVEKGTLPAKGEFAKIRVPNSYHVFYPVAMLGLIKKSFGLTSEQMKAYEQFGLGSDRYKVEQRYYNANPALGKIPLQVKVEARPKNSQIAFQPAPNATVYFELMRPDKLPDYQEDNNPDAARQSVAGAFSFYKQVVAPTLRGSSNAKGPADYIEARVTNYDKSDPNDPQASNTHAHLGGRRKLGNVSRLVQYSTGVFRENVFSAPLDDWGFEDLPVLKGKFANAVRVIANDEGVARVVFNPSRIGGDTYRLRAAVVDFSSSDEPVIASAETGTMVRWRTVRISRHLTMPVPRTLAELPPELQSLTNLNCEHKIDTGRVCLACQLGMTAPTPLAANCVRHNVARGNICYSCFLEQAQLPEVDFKGKVTREYAKAYSEVILEELALQPEPISNYGVEILEGALAMEQRYPLLNSTRFTSAPIVERLVADNTHANQFTATFKSDSFDVTSFTIKRFYKNSQAKDPTQRDKYTNAEILTTNVVQLVDTGRVTDGVTGTINYDTGELSVVFAQPPQVGVEYEVYYEPGISADLFAGSARFYGVTLESPVVPGSIVVQVKQNGVTTPNEDAIILHDSWGAMSPTDQCPEGMRGTIDYTNKIVTLTCANPPATEDYFELSYHTSSFLDLASLVYFPPRSPFLFNLQMPAVYNTNIQGTGRQPMGVDNTVTSGYYKPPTFFNVIDSDFGTVKLWLFQAVSYGLNNSQGFYPGIIFVHGSYLDTYTKIWKTGMLEGKGPGNIVYMFGHQSTNLSNPFMSLVLHEMSHTLYMVHAPLSVKSAIPRLHDTGDSSKCLMSYDPNKGDFCGQCLAILRGMNADDKRFVTISVDSFGVGVPPNATSLPVLG